jgi:5-methyltetrahydrofolate--homocysteine methyltransferase
MIRELFGKRLLFLDGAMGTQLQAAGLKPGDSPDLWNISHADTVRGIHLRYLSAGSDIITANTFGCNAYKLAGSGYSVENVVKSALANSKEAVAKTGLAQQAGQAGQAFSKPRFIALDIGPTGRLLKPLGDLHFEEAYSLFRETILAGTSEGADLILIETFSDAYELKAAVLAAKENSELPVIASVTLDEKGRMLTGGGVDEVITLLEGLRVDVIGFNCGLGPEQLTPHINHALSICSTPLMLMPNAGLPRQTGQGTQYGSSPEEFARLTRQNAENGVWLLGGCCGTSFEHIEAMVKTCASVTPISISRKNITVASSYGKTAVFGKNPLVIGERINPTGKPMLQKALVSGDYDYALREGLRQVENGANILDVNAGVPGIDETQVLAALVEQLQSVVDAPLQIDTANMDAMARAMRLYNGKPLVNSVNGKESVMRAIFPLVRRYGGVIIALTLDENGIPETVDGRVSIAKKILERALEYGIGGESFVFDPLTMAVSAGLDNARITLDCVRRLKEELGVKTSLGVSNVSFGLPSRGILNAAFLSLALDCGLDAAILNPNEELMRNALRAHKDGKPAARNDVTDALLGKDEHFSLYIKTYGKRRDDAVRTGDDEMALSEAILKGLKQQAERGARRCLEQFAPLHVIEREIIPALNTAGRRFEEGTMYLPQLLMCAEAAKSAFEVVRAAMGAGADVSVGTVVVATVEGDVHDIGKNIVRALLENYRFNVIDLGKDVPARRVVEAVQKHGAKLAGLSALMTTTVASMEKTIRELREAAPWCKIMCGGAVLTEEYARRIGADCYVKDAMASVRYAQQVFSYRE